MFKRLCMAYFSATDTTKKAVREISWEIANNLHIGEISELDFTPKNPRTDIPTYNEDDIVVIGLPTFAGRVPNFLLDYLNAIKANGSIGVAVMMYGNRAYEDALIELRNIMKKDGMKVVAAGAFVGEHSYSDIVAKGRPDAKDVEELKEFAQKIAKKIQKGDFSAPNIKDDREIGPQEERHKSILSKKVRPKTDKDKCTDCKICVKVCPTGAINFDDVSKVDGECMKCCACVKKCPEGAKYFDDEDLLSKKTKLETFFMARGKNEYFV